MLARLSCWKAFSIYETLIQNHAPEPKVADLATNWQCVSFLPLNTYVCMNTG